jgi:hypothetical protein
MENTGFYGVPYSFMGIDGVYSGRIKDGVPHGSGGYTYNDVNDATNSIHIEGTWEDGFLKSGIHRQNDWVFIGDFYENGHGKRGNISFSNGDDFVGTFNDEGDFQHGRLTNLEEDGTGWWYEGEFVDGMFNGTGQLYDNGVLFTGTWKDDLLDDNGTMELPNGTIYNGTWDNHRFDGSISYSNGVKCDLIGRLEHDGTKVVGYSEEMYLDRFSMDDRQLISYEGEFEDNMPVGLGSITWLFNWISLPIFSSDFNSFCIVSPDQYRELIQKKILEPQRDSIAFEDISVNTPKFYLFHFGLKLDQLDQMFNVKLLHPVDILRAALHELNDCPLCRLEYPLPVIDWIEQEADKVQTNAATNIQRFVRNTRTRIKKRASAATKIQRFVRSIRSRQPKKSNSRGGTKRSGTKRSGTKRSGTKRSGTKRSGTKRSGTKRNTNQY